MGESDADFNEREHEARTAKKKLRGLLELIVKVPAKDHSALTLVDAICETARQAHMKEFTYYEECKARHRR
jgi:hypothetical protein